MRKCPACDGTSVVGTGLVASCEKCGHRWLNRTDAQHSAVEAATFTRDYSGYRPDPTYVAAVTAMIREELVARVPPPARLLDVGCGAGDLLSAAQSLGYEVEGIDISEASAQFCKSKGVHCVAGDFLAHDFGQRFDLIVMWDVAAHLREPGQFLARARSLLGKGGMLFVKTPVFGALSVRLSDRLPRVAGTLLGAPSHNQFFSRESLSQLLVRTGFEPDWIGGGRARSPDLGGSLKRRIGRRAAAAVKRMSGDSSVYVAARVVD